MNILPFLIIAVIPVTASLLIIMFIFKRINKKYISMFEGMIYYAKSKSNKLDNILNTDPEKRKTIHKNLSSISSIIKVDVLRVSKTLAQLHVLAEVKNKPSLYYVEMTKTDRWILQEFNSVSK